MGDVDADVEGLGSRSRHGSPLDTGAPLAAASKVSDPDATAKGSQLRCSGGDGQGRASMTFTVRPQARYPTR